MSFEEHCRQAAERFIQTAVVIDNEAFAKRGSAAKGPKVARRAAVSPSDAAALAQPDEVRAPPEAAAADNDASVDENPLETRDLIRAFSEKKIICSVFELDEADGVIEAVRAVGYADLVIIDWYLERGSSQLAKEIIKRLLTDDEKAGGKLRFITVYTGQVGLQGLAAELKGFLEGDEGQCPATDLLHGNAIGLKGKNLRILFYNKEKVDGGAGSCVSAKELPGVLIGAFAEATGGLLPSLVLHAIATLRERTHSTLAAFHRDLDGAYLTHRSQIPHPVDAETFIEGIIGDRLRSLLAMEELGKNYANHGVCEYVVDATRRPGLDVAKLKELLAYNGDSGKFIKNSEIKQGLVLANAQLAFYDNDELATQRMREFGALTALAQSPHSGPSPANGWSPQLALGSLVKRVGNDEKPYLLCIQPVCDSVRLTEPTSFPCLCQTSKRESSVVVLPDARDSYQELFFRVKPSNIEMVKFCATQGSDRIRATKSGEKWIFTDVNGVEYEWFGTLFPLYAQLLVGRLGGQMDRVGFDQFEYLRLREKQ